MTGDEKKIFLNIYKNDQCSFYDTHKEINTFMILYIELLKKHIPHPEKSAVLYPLKLSKVCMCLSSLLLYIYTRPINLWC